jgi:hypothetical protein
MTGLLELPNTQTEAAGSQNALELQAESALMLA